ERGNSGLYQPVTGLVIEIGYQPKPAAIPLVGVSIKSCVGRVHCRGLVLFDCRKPGALSPFGAFCGVLCAEGERCPPRQAIACDGSVWKISRSDARAGCEPRGWPAKSPGSEA